MYSPRDLPDPGIEPGSPEFQADAFTIWVTREAYIYIYIYIYSFSDSLLL